MKKNIIYINSDHDNYQYINEAVISAQSFKEYIKDAKYILYTNNSDVKHEVFDKIVVKKFVVPKSLEQRVHKRGQMLVKHQAMIETDAAWNLVLGCDTLAVHPDVAGIFNVLDRFDIAAAHAPTRIYSPIPGIPKCFPEYNCDVIVFRKTDKMKRFLKKWKRMYAADVFEHPHDQGVFRFLLYNENIRLATLPFEYNDRIGIFEMQASRKERKKNKPIIIQNRELIRYKIANLFRE